MILLALRFPAFLPASNATTNMLSDSGASVRPAPIALYSSTICRKIGRAIISPPSAICCIVWPVMPRRKYFDRKRSGSSSAGFPSRLRLTSHQASEPSATRPTDDQHDDGSASVLPDEDPHDDAAHAERGQDRSDDVDVPVSRVRHVLDQTASRRGRSR